MGSPDAASWGLLKCILTMDNSILGCMRLHFGRASMEDDLQSADEEIGKDSCGDKSVHGYRRRSDRYSEGVSGRLA